MKVAKQAVSYYHDVTGNPWSDFYDKLDTAMSEDLSVQDDEMWLIHSLMNEVIKHGMSLNEFKINKDAVKAVFDEDSRKQNGEFFTPEVWAVEARKYFDKYIPNWHEYNVWETSCGSGNLVRSMGHNPDKLFMSTLQEDDVRMVQNTPEFAGANVFQCDFLSGIDYDEYNTQFLDKLPERLQQIIKNDEPLIIFSNPPYKTGMASATEVGRYMKESSTPEVDMSKPAYDMFYQFCWRYMKFVEMFNLTNCYCGFFGPLTFFTGAGANILLSEFEHYYDFVDGMCISAQEFSDTSDSIIWGIGFSLWKSTGADYNSFNRKDILLEKKYLLPDGSVGSKGRVLYEPPREKLSDWVAPKDVNMDITAPLATSHLTFKGSEVFEKVAPKSGKMASNALGTLMIGNTLTRSADQSAILSVPSTIMYTSITEENFWRCVASYTFRRIYDASWAVTKKEISAPNTNVEGYQQWLYNAIPLVLFEYKSMMASMRDVIWEGAKTDIHNHLFYLDETTVRQYCHDPVILEDLEKNPPCNQFMLNIIEQTKTYWAPEVKQLYDWCVNYTLATYDMRKSVNYKGSLECWDAGFQQIRSGCWDDKLNDELTKILVTARDFMKRDVDKFGFVSDADGEDL